MRRELTGKSKTLVHIWALIMAIVEIYIIVFGLIETNIHNNIFLAFVTSLIFLAYKPIKSGSNSVKWFDLTLALISILPFAYFVWNYSDILNRAARPVAADVVMMVIAVLCVLECCRRVIGWALPVISLVFIVYSFFGNYLSGIWVHRGYNIFRFTNIMYMTDNGIFGSVTKVAATTVFMFVLFGAYLNKSGAGEVLTQASFSVAGRYAGGPAKVAVISSGLMGMVSGSAASNVVTTGQLTIPLMKKVGYKPHFAAAVEAAASSGGTLTPPILGAAAFIMVEILQVRYGTIVRATILPALLFYIAIFLAVHFEAKKLKLHGSPRSELPVFGEVMGRGFHVLLPLVILIILICINYPIMTAAFISTVTLVVVSCIRSHTRMSFMDFVNGLVEGGLKTLPAAASCACAGIVIGVVNLTGLGLRFSQLAMQLARNSTFWALFGTMIMLIVLGMGLPAVASYVIGAAVAGPTLIGLGIAPLTAHLFIFYFSCISSITPPVALAAYLAAGIADANPLRTAFTACYIGFPVFVVPYMFVQSSALLLEGPFLVVLRVVVTSIIGVLGITFGTIGYFRCRIPILLRVLSFGCGLLLIDPAPITDIIGISGLALVIIVNYFQSKKELRMKVEHEQNDPVSDKTGKS